MKTFFSPLEIAILLAAYKKDTDRLHRLQDADPELFKNTALGLKVSGYLNADYTLYPRGITLVEEGKP